MTTAEVIERLENVRRAGDGWSARCPAHEDDRSSLSVNAGDDGTILVKCHAGCPTDKVMKAIGKTLRDLFPSTNGHHKSNGKATLGSPIAIYDYCEFGGKLLYQVCRYEPKDFRQRRPDGNGGLSWKLGNVRRVLYRLPELLAADTSEPVFIPEGEKDVDNLRKIGLVATCNAGGAGKWKSDYNETLRGRHAVLLPDNDQPGADHDQDIARNLHGIAASIKIVELPGLPEKGDVSDWLKAGGTVEQLRELVAQATLFTPTATPPAEPTDDKSPTTDGGFRNFFFEEVEKENKKGDVETVVESRGFPIRVLHESLQQLTCNWPKAANGLLFTEGQDHVPAWMKSATETFAWIGGQLPASDRNKLQWAKGPDKVSEAQFHAFIVQNAERFEAVEQIPHYPPMPGHYYMHPPLKGGDGSAFRELLQRFSPSTLIDSDLIMSALLTPFAGIEPGQRPAFLIQAEDDDKHGGRGAGKTTLVELIGRLCGGHIEMRATDDWDRLVTRLLSPNALTKRIALLDNVKTLRFSWAELEAGITAAIISGRQLYVGEGRRPNTLTYFVTLNGANLSKDMAQRCVPIIVKRPIYDAAWEEGTIKLIDAKRWEIIGDIINILTAPSTPLRRFSRWSTWEKAVLSRVDQPSDCQKVIEERQAAVDDDQTEADIVRVGFQEELRRRGHNPETDIVWMPSSEAAKIVNRIENEERRPFNRAMAHLYLIGIPEIRKSNRAERGCVWTGLKADPQATATRLHGGVG